MMGKDGFFPSSRHVTTGDDSRIHTNRTISKMLGALPATLFVAAAALMVLAIPEGWPETHTDLMSKRTYFESQYPIPCATACMYIDIVWR